MIALLIAGPFGCGGGGGGGPTAVATMGALEVGFVDSPAKSFQAITLNILSVRLNPTKGASDADPNWVTVTVPPGTAPGELSINLLDLQNNAMVFNTGQIPAQAYQQIEVVVDPNFPGIVIPSCTSGTQEGCITASAVLSGSTNLQTSATVNVAPGGLTPLIIDINPGTPTLKTSGSYQLNPTITVSSNTLVGTVKGTVSGVSATSGDSINAELTGTNAVVATAPVQANGSYAINLPASGIGSVYDLFVSGGTTFAVLPGLAVSRGGNFTENFSVATGSVGTIAGIVLDGRTGGALVGATVNLLLPQSSAQDCVTSLAGCVVVSTTTSNSSGNYSFAVPPPTGVHYYVQGSFTGTNTTTEEVTTFAIPSTCSPNPNNCNISLPNALLTGTVNVNPLPSPGTNVVVTVIAEQTGTGNLVGLTQVTVPPSGNTPFSMEVPSQTTVDLIASAEDSYLGVGTQFSGHQLAVASSITPPGNVPLTVSCLGHGTIAGLANNADAGTHVRLFQSAGAARVQLMDSTVGAPMTQFTNQYSFCAPPNAAGSTYQVQRFEQSGPLATPVPAGPAQPIVVPVPAPTATTPCPLCQSALVPGQCPGNCSATAANPL